MKVVQVVTKKVRSGIFSGNPRVLWQWAPRQEQDYLEWLQGKPVSTLNIFVQFYGLERSGYFKILPLDYIHTLGRHYKYVRTFADLDSEFWIMSGGGHVRRNAYVLMRDKKGWKSLARSLNNLNNTEYMRVARGESSNTTYVFKPTYMLVLVE